MVSTSEWPSKPSGGNSLHTTSQRVRNKANLVSSQNIPVAFSASNGAQTPRGEQASRRQSLIEPKKMRIRWSDSLDKNLLNCYDNVQARKGHGKLKELLKLWEELHPELPSSVGALKQR